MAEFRYPAKVYLLVALLGAMTLAYAVTRLAEAKEYQDTYPFRAQYARLAGIQPLIAGERKVGYLSDLDPSLATYARLYFPTQYVLAPTLLVPIDEAADTKFVLGNFTRKDDYVTLGKQHGLEIVKEFPMGAVLYRRAESVPGTEKQALPIP
jgi:hypothetical protein